MGDDGVNVTQLVSLKSSILSSNSNSMVKQVII